MRIILYTINTILLLGILFASQIVAHIDYMQWQEKEEEEEEEIEIKEWKMIVINSFYQK